MTIKALHFILLLYPKTKTNKKKKEKMQSVSQGVLSIMPDRPVSDQWN